MTTSGQSRGGVLSFTGFLTVISVALAVLVLLLALQNRSLKAELTEAREAAEDAHLAAEVPLLDVGDVLAPFTLLDDSGAALPLDFAASPAGSLLLFYSLDCPACQENMPVWDDLLSEGSPALRVRGIRLEVDPASAPIESHLFPVFDPLELAELPLERLRVPATVMVDTEGVVEAVWYGVLSGSEMDELRALLFP